MRADRFLILLAASVALPSTLPAQEPPSYARQVKPFLAKYCLECHSGDRAKAALDLDTFRGLMAGGKSGPAIVPGKPDDSRLVLAVEGTGRPAMPPKKARQPKAREIGVLRAWVAAGARDDSTTVATVIPDIKPTVPAVGAVASLAYRPDGKLLAAGTHKEVLLIDPASGDVVGKLSGQLAKVTALAFSGDGQRLAVASGAPGTAGEVRLYSVPAGGLPAEKPGLVLAAHADMIHDAAFSPDGKVLATCGYDRLIKLWDVATGKELRTLKDHSDAVYGVAFSPDGRLLASASADRAVKVWDVATGGRLATLADSTDWVYAVAWSPDGRHVAAGGVDRSIRIWEVAATGEKRLARAAFAHEAAITRLIYSPDGKTLYSVAEDHTLKAWDAAHLTERTVYPKQPEVVLALALRPDAKQLALGRYDGTLILLDEATGKVQSEPLPAKPKLPQVTKLSPTSGQPGQTLRITFEGKYLDEVTEITPSLPGVSAKLLPEGRTPGSLQADVTFPATTPAGAYQLGLKSPAGEAKAPPFIIDLFAPTTEAEPNDSPSTGQLVKLPATLVGSLQRAGDVDFYRFEAQAGQQLGVQAVTATIGSKLESVLKLTDAGGNLLAETTNGVFGYTFDKAGTYALGIRDRDFRGGPEMFYRLHVGDVPVVTAVFPLGLQRGTEADIHIEGVNLGDVKWVRVKAPADAAVGSRLPLSVTTPKGTPLGDLSVLVGEFPESLGGGNAPRDIAVPGTANGRIAQPGAAETWRFTAKKGQRFILETNARRLGSPLDSFIEILDSQGQPLPRAVLRSVSKTETVFRDHDSSGPGIRIESWNDLAINDYLYVGSELVRIWALPRNPDDDCEFYSHNRQRVSFLDTTPTHHSLGTPMYKVTIRPPGTMFPPNGLPVFTLTWRNDDGGPGYGKDSRLFFDPAADGEYQVRVGDARGQGGPGYGYRLTVRPPRPDFQVSFSPTAPAVWKGGAVPVTVNAERIDGFEGPIDIHPENLPAGFSALATTIPAGEDTTALALWADPTAVATGKVPPLELVARASINGQEVIHKATGGVPSVAEPGDLVTVTEQPEVTVRPGGIVHLTVKIERRNGFTGRVPLDVRGLPHGVQVLDVGLNGILITEGESARTITIACEPWVAPTEHPFVVLSRSEKKNTEHAAKSVLLKVEK